MGVDLVKHKAEKRDEKKLMKMKSLSYVYDVDYVKDFTIFMLANECAVHFFAKPASATE